MLPRHVLGHLAPEAIARAGPDRLLGVAGGAFVLVRWERVRQVVLRRNERCHRGPARLDGYRLRVLPDPNGLIGGLRRGDVHLAPIDPALWERAGALPEVVWLAFDTPRR